MLVNEIMTRQVVAIGPDTPIRDVQRLMEQRNIRHFPILEERSGGGPDHLVGIVSDRDLLRAGAHTAASNARTVADIMTRRVVSCVPATGLRVLAEVMVGQRIGAVPVLNTEGALIGIVSRSDILKSLMREAPLETWV